jgi:hypothetical protein
MARHPYDGSVGDLGRGKPRVVRGLGLAGACVGLPIGAHVLAAGSLPAPGPYLLAAVFLAAICIALADDRRGLLEIATVVGLSQPVLHSLLTHCGSEAESTPRGGVALGDGWTMFMAHVVAATVLTVLLAGAERVFWALAAVLGALPRPVPAASSVAVHQLQPVPRGRAPRPYARISVNALCRRGPPA